MRIHAFAYMCVCVCVCDCAINLFVHILLTLLFSSQIYLCREFYVHNILLLHFVLFFNISAIVGASVISMCVRSCVCACVCFVSRD